MENQRIIEKIKNLMNLANDNRGNEHECQLAFAKAQELMAKYNIELKNIKSESITREVNKLNIDMKRYNKYAQVRLCNMIANNFRCKALRDCNGIVFVGLKDDVEIAIEVFNTAQSIMLHNAKSIKSKTKSQSEYLSYIVGFVDGLELKFKHQVEKNNWGLIIVKPQEVVDYLNKNVIKGKERKVKPHKDMKYSNSYHQGYQDGNKFENQKRIN